MTVIENINPKVQYNGPVIIGEELPINFPYSNPEDVKVVIGDTALIYNEDYTVYNQSVTTKVAVDKDSIITIYRETPLDQQVEFPQNSRFNSAKINEALDKLCMQQQEQAEIIDRCIKFNIASSYNQPSLPNPQANNTLIWDKEGAALKNYDIIGENNAFKEGINKEMADNQAATEARFEQFSSETNAKISTFENTVTEQIRSNKADTDSQIATNKVDTDSQIATNKAETDAQIATNKADTDAQIAANKADTDAQIETFEAETTASIAEFKAETTTSIETFKADINESLDEVLEAAAKVNQLEEAVETASTAATNATTAANNATASASAAEQVALETQQLLQETTEEIDKTLGEATELIEEFQETIDTRADRDLSNLSEEGENKFAKTEDLVEVNLDAKANTDLANLSEEGQAKFDVKVNKAGDTMTGSLTVTSGNISAQDGFIYSKGTNNQIDFAATTAPASTLNGGMFNLRDKNDQVNGQLISQLDSNGYMRTSIVARRSVNGEIKTAQIWVCIKDDGTIGTYAPTPATNDNSTKIATTAWVNNSAVMKSTLAEAYVVTQTYVNGTSWYRVWSDGWCEQGGKQYVANSEVKVTFLKQFKDTNYYANCRSISVGTYNSTASIESLLPASMGIRSTSTATWAWYACGYIA